MLFKNNDLIAFTELVLITCLVHTSTQNIVKNIVKKMEPKVSIFINTEYDFYICIN